MISMIGTPSSSSILEYGYEKDNRVLAVRFHTGKLYHYNGVSERAYNMMRAADSVGKYFNTHIKNQHKFKYIEEKK